MATERRQQGVLTLTIHGAKEYFRSDPGAGNRRQSQTVNLCGVEWATEAYRDGTALAVYIRYAGSVPFRDDWRFYVTSVIRVRKWKAEDVIEHSALEISKESTSARSGTAVSVGVLLEPACGFLEDNTVTIVCSIVVKVVAERTLDAKRRCTDLKVVIGDRHFHVNKGILATHCDYFDALLFGDVGERAKDEISLDGLGIEVDPDDFATLMRIMSRQEAVTDHNVTAIMPLANYFGAKAILDECEEVVLGKLFPPAKAICIVDKSGIRELTEHFFAKLCMSDLEELARDEVLPTLSKDTSDLVTKEFQRRLKQYT